MSHHKVTGSVDNGLSIEELSTELVQNRYTGEWISPAAYQRKLTEQCQEDEESGVHARTLKNIRDQVEALQNDTRFEIGTDKD